MKLIILIIIIFLIVRAVRKKNKDTSASGSGAAAAETTASSSAKAAQKTETDTGVDVSVKDEEQVYMSGFWLDCQKMRSTPPAKADIPTDFDDCVEQAIYGDPDLAFLCAKLVVEECQSKEPRLVLQGDTKNMAYHYMEIGLKLAKYYLDGYGCDRNPEAGIQLLNSLIAFYQRQSNAGCDISMSVIGLCFNIHLTLADCYAVSGDQRKANQYYRMSFAMAKAFGNGKENVRIRVMEHVFGEFDQEQPRCPRPMSHEVASELALSMMALGHPMGGHYIRICTEFNNVDTGRIGKSWGEDLKVYQEAAGVYSLYRVGRYLLYGLGLSQNVKEGLDMLIDAYSGGSVQAANQIRIYYHDLESYGEFSDKAQKRQVKELSDRWSKRADRLKRNRSAMEAAMSVSGAAQMAEEYVQKFKYR